MFLKRYPLCENIWTYCEEVRENHAADTFVDGDLAISRRVLEVLVSRGLKEAVRVTAITRSRHTALFAE
jgi:hypothetical protein